MTRFTALVRAGRWAALLGLAATACAGGSDPILVGIAGPLSEARGESMRLAAELARDEINAAGGINGRPIELVLRDDSANADAAVRVARGFYDDDRVVAVVGHLTSGTTLAAAPIYNGGRTPLVEISPSASSPELSGIGRYTFRVCPTDLAHGAALAEWARRQLRANTAAIIYQNDDYGRGVRTTFAEGFRGLGGIVRQTDPYLLDMGSLSPYLERLARERVDALMIAGTLAGALRILPLLDSLGLRPIVLGGDGLTGLQNAPVRSEGVYISSPYLPDQPGERNQAFLRAYRQANPDKSPDHRGAGAYDILHLLARVLRDGGTSREALRDGLAAVGNGSAAFEGVTGRIAFDARGDVPGKPVVIGVIRRGQLVTAQ